MSGLDKIISRLENDCAKECSRIEEEAMLRAHSILTDAENATKAEYDRMIAEAEKQAELINKKAESAAAMTARRGMLEAKIAVIDETIEAAVKKLRALDTESYFSVLSHLASKYAQSGTGVMYLSKNDKDRMPEKFVSTLNSVIISEDTADIQDGFILKYGDIEINCTFSSMLNAAREELKATAGDILFA